VSGVRGEGTYNVVVIGGGTAGLVTAAGTAGLGGRVALVESHRMGGDCLNTGCVPSKALIASARAARTVRHAARWALGNGMPEVRLADVMARVRERRARIAPNDSPERFESLGVDVFSGHARLRSPREVDVDGRVLRTRNVVIASGSRAALPDVPGLTDVRVFTNETIFDEIADDPGHLVVLGGGPIGCELGQAFAALGVRVTIVEVGPRLLAKEDADAADVVRAALEADGVRVLVDTKLERVERAGAGARLHLRTPGGPEPLVADTLLVAAGRAPRVDDMGLEQAGVAFTRKGVTVDAHLQTSQPGVWAAGDVVGSLQFTHLADHHARVLVRNILFPWWKQSVDTRVLPWCTYTSPEVGRVGLGEQDAQRDGIAVDVFRVDLHDLDRAIVDGEETGFARVLTARGTDRILGATVVGAHGGDLVHEIALAMKLGAGLGQLSGAIHAYPSWAEVVRKLGDRYQRTRLTPRARSLFERLYRWQRG
jgi:pyruvate/2-oxoglutarate dehydrogenase complex dihydrolipoamide dehydrogenase (E3) component